MWFQKTDLRRNVIFFLLTCFLFFLSYGINIKSFSQVCEKGDVICPDSQMPCCEKFKPHCKEGEAKCCKKKKDGSGWKCKDKDGNTFPVVCKDSCEEEQDEDETVTDASDESRVEECKFNVDCGSGSCVDGKCEDLVQEEKVKKEENLQAQVTGTTPVCGNGVIEPGEQCDWGRGLYSQQQGQGCTFQLCHGRCCVCPNSAGNYNDNIIFCYSTGYGTSSCCRNFRQHCSGGICLTCPAGQFPNDAGTNCIQCISSTQCSGNTPICTSGKCVQCTENLHCVNNPYGSACNTSTNTCGPCTNSTQCSGATPVCNTVAGTTTFGKCVQCTAGDFSACTTTPTTPACNTATNTCVQCTATYNICAENTPICDAANTCVRCTTNPNNCPSNAVCTETGACVQCPATQFICGNTCCPVGQCSSYGACCTALSGGYVNSNGLCCLLNQTGCNNSDPTLSRCCDNSTQTCTNGTCQSTTQSPTTQPSPTPTPTPTPTPMPPSSTCATSQYPQCQGTCPLGQVCASSLNGCYCR